MEIFINGKRCDIHTNKISSYVIYSASELDSRCADIRISLDGDAGCVTVRPKSRGIVPSCNANEITLCAPVPSKLSVEFEGSDRLPIFLFLYEPNTPVERTDNVRYYAKGEYFENELRLSSGEVLYLEEGAVLHAHILADDVENITVCGRGIIDLDGYSEPKRRLALIRNCKNITFRDVTFSGANGWCLPFFGCEGILVDGVNIMTWLMCGDGVDIVGSHDAEVKNCFICANDDCVAIKSTDYCGPQGLGDVYNVRVHDCVMWNQIYGNGIEIGFETRCEEIYNVEFSDIDLIHVEQPGWQACGCITIHNGDRARVHDVVYRNIRIEDASSRLFDFRNLDSRYSKDAVKGSIDNILVENVSVVEGAFPPSVMLGFSDKSLVDHVRFVDLSVRGQKIRNYVDARMIIDKAPTIIFEVKDQNTSN